MLSAFQVYSWMTTRHSYTDSLCSCVLTLLLCAMPGVLWPLAGAILFSHFHCSSLCFASVSCQTSYSTLLEYHISFQCPHISSHDGFTLFSSGLHTLLWQSRTYLRQVSFLPTMDVSWSMTVIPDANRHALLLTSVTRNWLKELCLVILSVTLSITKDSPTLHEN